MRILLIGDYSNLHSQLGKTLREMGHDVTVMSDGSGFMHTGRDIDVQRTGGPAGGALLTLKCLTQWRSVLRGNDIVALQNPHFLPLKPARLRYILHDLCRHNGGVFLTAAGTDNPYLDVALDPHGPLRYNEWRLGNSPSPHAIENADRLRRWQSPEMRDYHKYVYDHLAGAVSVLYEYHPSIERTLGADRVAYAGIPVDVEALQPVNIQEPVGKVRFFLGRHRGRLTEKGTDLLESAARTIVQRHPQDAELTLVENMLYADYVKTMRSAHVVLDQVYSLTPATNALLAMAQGLNVVSGGEPEYYDFIGEHDLHPVINAPITLDALVETLDNVVRERQLIPQRSTDSRLFVERHNDSRLVARRFLDFWTSRL